MSYQGDDKWGVYIRRLSLDARSMAEMKAEIRKHLMGAGVEISKASSPGVIEAYQITDVKLTIKKVKP